MLTDCGARLPSTTDEHLRSQTCVEDIVVAQLFPDGNLAASSREPFLVTASGRSLSTYRENSPAGERRAIRTPQRPQFRTTQNFPAPGQP
jgi:hypothetical protein